MAEYEEQESRLPRGVFLTRSSSCLSLSLSLAPWQRRWRWPVLSVASRSFLIFALKKNPPASQPVTDHLILLLSFVVPGVYKNTTPRWSNKDFARRPLRLQRPASCLTVFTRLQHCFLPACGFSDSAAGVWLSVTEEKI